MSDLPNIRIIIAGGRDFSDYNQLCGDMYIVTGSWKTATRNRLEIVSGGARGADRLGEEWSEFFLDKKATIFPALWVHDGPSAGHIRNKAMAAHAADATPYGILIAHWDGRSKGTRDMINQALNKHLEVHVFNYESEDQ